MFLMASVMYNMLCHKQLSSELKLMLIPGQAMGELPQTVSSAPYRILYS